MKNINLYTLSLILAIVLNDKESNGQAKKIGLYKWNESVIIQPSDINGGALAAPKLETEPGQKFRVIAIKINKTTTKNIAVIKFLDYTSYKRQLLFFNKRLIADPRFYKFNYSNTPEIYKLLDDPKKNSRNYGADQRYFTVELTEIDSLASKVLPTKVGGALAFGIINFPFKYRTKKNSNDFTGAFNFGAALGYKLPHRTYHNFTYSLLSGYSISNVVLDSASTGKNQSKLASTNNFTAFSFSLGFLVEYQKVQAGVFIGWDQINRINQNQFEWQYQGKPWLSVGFGYSIFAPQTTKADSKSNTTQD